MSLTSNIKIWRGPAPPFSADASRHRGLDLRSVGGLVAAWLLLGTAWELGARVGVLNAAILPPPSQFIPYLIATSGSVGLGVNCAFNLLPHCWLLFCLSSRARFPWSHWLGPFL